MGQEMRAVGVTTTFGPVADIDSNPESPVIGIRSPGETPEVVASFAGAALKGLRAHVGTFLKHVPGHGEAKTDTHTQEAIVDKSAEELERDDWYPFKALASKSDGLMTAHVRYPALDPKHCATFSPKIVGKIRKMIGPNKIIVTDSLVMQAALNEAKTIPEAALRALEAGCDMLCISGGSIEAGKIPSVHQAIMDAVLTGRISKERIEQSCQRVLDFKKRLFSILFPEKPLTESVGTKEHLRRVQLVAEKSIQVVKGPVTTSLKGRTVQILYSPGVKEELEHTNLFDNSTEAVALDQIKEPLKDADIRVWVVYNTFKNPDERKTLTSLTPESGPIVLITTGSSCDSNYFRSSPHIITIVNTYSPSRHAIQIAFSKIFRNQEVL